MRFRAVLFDAGETLVHPAPSFPELFASVLLDAGHVRTPDAVDEASRAVFDRFREASRDGERWTTTPERSARFWKGVYARMLEALDLPEQDGLRDALYATFTDLDNYALFDDVIPVLDELAGTGTTLGVVSNFEPWLRELLVRLDVVDRFPVLVISGQVGIEKPDPRIYRLGLEAAGADAGDAAYVGDNPEFDVDPVRALGITAVLIDRRERFPAHPGPRITDLRELPVALREAS